MPTYDYKCQGCSEVIERIELPGERFDGPPTCACGGEVRRVLLTAPTIHFVGMFSGATRPASGPTARSLEENNQEAKIQKRNKDEAQKRVLDKHVDKAAQDWDWY